MKSRPLNLRHRIAALVMTAGLVTAPLLTGVVSAQAAPRPAQAPTEAVTRAADWLSEQFTDGQYLTGFDGTSADPAYTIDGVLGLVAADSHPETVESAMTWLTGQAAEYVVDPGTAARMALAASATGADPADFGGVDLLEAMQGDLGDLSTNPYGLALLTIALERNGVDAPAGVTDALLATQGADGAFGFPDFGPDADATAVAAQALSLVSGAAAQDNQHRAVAWLLDQQCTETSEMCPETGAYWGSYSPANTAGLAIPALRLAGTDNADQIDWLVDQQRPDGGFGPALDADQSDGYATAQALLGLTDTALSEVGEPSTELPVPTHEPGSFSVDPVQVAGLVAALIVVGGAGILAIRAKD